MGLLSIVVVLLITRIINVKLLKKQLATVTALLFPKALIADR